MRIPDVIEWSRSRDMQEGTGLMLGKGPTYETVGKLAVMHEGRIGRAGTRDELLPLLIGETVTPMRREERRTAERHHGPDRRHGDVGPRLPPYPDSTRSIQATRQ